MRLSFLNLLLLSLGALLVNCSPDKETETNKTQAYYFEFDQVQHYHTNISEEAVDKLLTTEDKAGLTRIEKLKREVILRDRPDSLKDSSFVDKLENIGFEAHPVPGKKHSKIKAIFKEKNHEKWIGNSCAAVYRDILVFQHKNKITGIAKICFKCNQHDIVGTQANTRHFGQSGDYAKLHALLNETDL